MSVQTTEQNCYVYDNLTKLGWKLHLDNMKGNGMNPVTLNGNALTDAYGWK